MSQVHLVHFLPQTWHQWLGNSELLRFPGKQHLLGSSSVHGSVLTITWAQPTGAIHLQLSSGSLPPATAQGCLLPPRGLCRFLSFSESITKTTKVVTKQLNPQWQWSLFAEQHGLSRGSLGLVERMLHLESKKTELDLGTSSFTGLKINYLRVASEIMNMEVQDVHD